MEKKKTMRNRKTFSTAYIVITARDKRTSVYHLHQTNLLLQIFWFSDHGNCNYACMCTYYLEIIISLHIHPRCVKSKSDLVFVVPIYYIHDCFKTCRTSRTINIVDPWCAACVETYLRFRHDVENLLRLTILISFREKYHYHNNNMQIYLYSCCNIWKEWLKRQIKRNLSFSTSER